MTLSEMFVPAITALALLIEIGLFIALGLILISAFYPHYETFLPACSSAI